jgi:O-6-methylguanine DNA methyltransferase
MSEKPTISTGPIYYTQFTVPQFARIGLALSPKGLCRVTTHLTDESTFRKHLQTHFSGAVVIKNPRALQPFQKQFEQYFSGRRRDFDLPLDFGLATPFEKKVWRALSKIPFGATRSYQWLATAVSRPRAFRAAGNANGKNPLPIIVPCHRVTRKNGDLGGYSTGLRTKRLLLDLEQARNHGAL